VVAAVAADEADTVAVLVRDDSPPVDLLFVDQPSRWDGSGIWWGSWGYRGRCFDADIYGDGQPV
jgi:hypothetical protein